MSLPQHVTCGVGGTIHVDVKDLPLNARVSILDFDGTALVSSGTANVSQVNTTLSGAGTKGDTAINVSSNTGFAVGVTCWLQDDPEEILVRKISGGTISLRRPLMYDHANAATVEGSRISYTVNAAVANTPWWDGRAEWNIDGTIQHYTAVECTKYPLVRLATAQDLFDIEPKIYHLLDDEADIERLLDLGMEQVLKRVALSAPDLRARVYTGSMEFRHATALAALSLYYMRQPGEMAKDMWTRYREELEKEIQAICQVVPRDANQDGTMTADERPSVRTVVLRRA